MGILGRPPGGCGGGDATRESDTVDVVTSDLGRHLSLPSPKRVDLDAEVIVVSKEPAS